MLKSNKVDIPAQVIAESRSFKIFYFDNSSDTLFITFNGISGGLDTPVFGREFLLKQGYSVIGCNQRKGSFYQELSFFEFKKILKPYCNKYKNIYLYGSSLGGYCAIYYAGAVNGTVIASSPRLTLYPAMVENNILSNVLKKHAKNTEFRHMEFCDLPATLGRVHVFHDPMNPADKFFMGLIKKIENLNLHVHMVNYAGHSTMIKCLRLSGCFPDIWSAIMQGEVNKVGHIIKNLRPNEYQYLNHLSHLNKKSKPSLSSISPGSLQTELLAEKAENILLQARCAALRFVSTHTEASALNRRVGDILIRAFDSPRTILTVPVQLWRVAREFTQGNAPEGLGKDFCRLIETCMQCGYEQAEKMLNAAQCTAVVQANAYTALARYLRNHDRKQAAQAARQAYQLDPRAYRLKSLIFRLYEADEVLEAAALLECLPQQPEPASTELEKFNRIKAEARQASQRTALLKLAQQDIQAPGTL